MNLLTRSTLLCVTASYSYFFTASPDWSSIASNFPNWTAINCLSKWKELSKASNTKGKGSWSPEEDAILREKRVLYGRKWSKIASYLPGRQGKQCRERYINHLDPLLKKGEWTDDEEAILIASHQRHGNRWAVIAKELPGRSDNDVKNHWYSTIQRKFHMHGKDVSIFFVLTWYGLFILFHVLTQLSISFHLSVITSLGIGNRHWLALQLNRCRSS